MPARSSRPGSRALEDPAAQTGALVWLRQGGRSPRPQGHDARLRQIASSLLATAQRHLELERGVRAAMPVALQSACHVLRFEDGQLTIGVPTAAHSAKLRQLGPRIAAALDKAGWQVNGIVVRVQAGLNRPLGAPAPVAPGKPNELGAKGVAAFEALRDTVTDKPLAQAIARLVERRRQAGSQPESEVGDGDQGEPADAQGGAQRK